MFILSLRVIASSILLSALYSIIFLSLSVTTVIAAVGSKNSNEAIDPAMQELLAVLDEKTEIATHTKINIDYVPGMVSVLHGKDLRARGVRTVREALSFVPGIEISSNNTGQLLVIVRGVGRVLGTSKIKILLDGIALNSTLQAAALPLFLPIQLVDRIEVIRGPGSAIYGEFASVGVINIITRQSENKVFLGGSDQSRGLIGGQYHFKNENVGLNLLFSIDQNEGGRVKAGNDILENIPAVTSNAPGPINDKARRSYVSLRADVDNFNIQWQRLEYKTGDYFGAANALPSDSNRFMRKSVTQNVNVNFDSVINEAITANIKMGWLRSLIASKQHVLFPAGFPKVQADPDPSLFDPNVFVNGVLGGPHYEEDKYYLISEVNIITELDHNVLIGTELSQVKQGTTYANRNYSFDGVFSEIPNQRYTGAKNWLREGLERRLVALYIQDQYALTKKLNITTGIRYDKYDDIGSDVTPRIASVYQIDQTKTFKVQFAESFRPPLFLEMYSQNNPAVNGNPDLKSERLNTIEVSYTFNNSKTIARLSLFHYKMIDLILNDPLTFKYKNSDEVTADGLEFEFQRDLNRKWKIEYLMSNIDVHDKSGGHLPNIARFMSTAGLFYVPMPDWSVSLRYRYESGRGREPGDSRDRINAYNIVNLALTVNELYFKRFSLTASIHNLFDADINHPSSRTSFGANNLFTYKEDYPQLGREIEVSINYNFL